MPEKKIIEAVMSTLPVIGSSMATATAGPMPGSTPTAVPRAQPMRHHSRLMGVIAAAKPVISALKISIWRGSAQIQPVLVRPGRLMARNLVNIQKTGAEIARPVTKSVTQVAGALTLACPAARRRPCTASR
ncbi:hypothetical protein D3C72_1145430 [compost metagenome]